MEDRKSVFADHNLYEHVWDVELLVGELHGGTPLDPRKAEAWIRTALGETPEQYAARIIQDHLADLKETDIEAAPRTPPLPR